MVHLMRVKEDYRLELRKICFDRHMLRQIIQNGVPSGFQNSVIAIANVFVQSNINAFGKMAMAGCGAYSKVEGPAGDLLYYGDNYLCGTESWGKAV